MGNGNDSARHVTVHGKRGLLVLAVILMAACSTTSATQSQAAPPKPEIETEHDQTFTGVWSVEWCSEPKPANGVCGGFQAYISQVGTRICGTHYGADERVNRMDEGESRSIIGSVAGSTAVLAITSGRNHGIYLATAKIDDETLAWDIVDVVKEGTNGEPAFIADGDKLRKTRSAEDLEYLNSVIKSCSAKGEE